MSSISAELRISIIALFFITAFYLIIAQNGLPGSSSAVGYGLGIVGFLFMLGAEVLYTWRKQQKGGGMGKMRTWLQLHIILGLIGPYLVLLHSAWRLNGVAGIAMLLTFLMVASGFLLSYIYPALPRNVEGAELSLPEIEAQIKEAHTRLQAWTSSHPEAAAVLGRRIETLSTPASGSDVMIVLGRSYLRWRHQQAVRHELRKLQGAGIEQAGELEQLLDRHYVLETQTQSLAAARKILGQARTLHIAVGVVLFALVFVHIAAALYYAALAY
jgi:hypothetical protein